jgi:hypothetical protein
MPMATVEAQREYQRRWVARRRATYFMDKVYADCGTGEDLQLDHRDPSKKVDHKIWSWSQERRAAELEKCQILCASCHWKKTLKSDRKRAEHGSGQIYQLGCRCQRCKEWKSANDREYRKHPRGPRPPRTRREVGAHVRARHGACTMYREYGCRCTECLAWRHRVSGRKRAAQIAARVRFRNGSDPAG